MRFLNLCSQLDCAVFVGNYLSDKETRKKFARLLKKWKEEVESYNESE